MCFVSCTAKKNAQHYIAVFELTFCITYDGPANVNVSFRQSCKTTSLEVGLQQEVCHYVDAARLLIKSGSHLQQYLNKIQK